MRARHERVDAKLLLINCLDSAKLRVRCSYEERVSENDLACFMTVAGSLSTLALLGLWALASIGYAQGNDVRRPAPVYIEIKADGKTCVVRGAAIDCGKVLLHLRQVVKLAPGSEVRFNADRETPFGSIKSVMDEVQKSEYATAVGYLTAPR